MTRLITVIVVSLLIASAPPDQTRPQRIISLIPAVTEMLFAIGAGPQVIAVSSFDEYPPEVKNLQRVGALLDPDVERILSLRPDLVVVFGSQEDLSKQLARANVATFSYRDAGLAEACHQPCRTDRIKHPDRRHVERQLQRLADRDIALVAHVEILRPIAAKIDRTVLDQHFLRHQPLLEGEAIDERLQRRAGRTHDPGHVDPA